MVAYFRQAGRRASLVGVGVMSFLGLIAAYAAVHLSGTKTGLALTIASVFGPIILMLAITNPVLFPFGVYAMLTPFDSLLAVQGGTGGTFLAVLGAGSGAAFLFLGMRSKRFADPDVSVGVWLIYTLWIVASMFWAIDSTLSLNLLPTALELFGLYAVVSLIRVGEKELVTVLTMVAIGGVLAGLYLFYLAHTGVAVHEDRMYLRTTTNYWNPDFLSTELILPFLIALSGALWTRNVLLQAASFVGVAIIGIAVVMTGARGAELGILAGVIYLVVRHPNRGKIFGVLGLFAVLVGAFQGPAFMVRWNEAMTDGGAGRMDIWRVGWLAFKHNWLFGAGFDNFAQAYNQVYIQVFQPLDVGWGHVSHNIIVGNAVELGIIGVTILLIGWFVQFRALRSVGADDSRYPIRLCLEASIVGLFIAGLFADIMIIKCSWLAFMLINLTRNAGLVPKRSPAVNASVQHA